MRLGGGCRSVWYIAKVTITDSFIAKALLLQFQLRQIVLGYLASLFLWGSSGAVFAQPISGLIDQELPVAVSNMKSLIEQGRFGEAFNLGLRHDFLSGDPRYDYYYGVAAIKSGRAALGVLALERLLLSNPENDLARLELARGYFVWSDCLHPLIQTMGGYTETL